MNPDDVFHIIGFTRQDILNGVQMGTMDLSTQNLRAMGELWHRVGPLAIAVANGVVTREIVEVYFLSPFDVPGTVDMAERYGQDFQQVEFFNETALRLCRLYRIALPQIIGQTTRAELPEPYGISMRFPSYVRNSH